MPNTSDAFDIRTCAQNAAIGATCGVIVGAALYVTIVSGGTVSFSGSNDPVALAFLLSAAVGVAIVSHACLPLLVGCVAGGLVIGAAAGALSGPINNYLNRHRPQSTSLDITPVVPTNDYRPLIQGLIPPIHTPTQRNSDSDWQEYIEFTATRYMATEQNSSGRNGLFLFHDKIKAIMGLLKHIVFKL